MAGGTVVRYGEVWIKDCETLGFNQEVVYDESGTDAVFSKFSIRVLGSVHPDQLQTHAVQFGTVAIPGPAAGLVQILHARLSQPRQRFEYIVDGQVLLYATASSSGSTLEVQDCNNGPKPRRVDIVKVVGARLYRVEFEIEVCVIKCVANFTDNATPGWPPEGTLADPRVINNRWTVQEERDANFFNSRVIEGTLRVSHATNWPHRFRYFVVPPLRKGYRREVQRFWDSADGLTLRYLIVDRQKYAAPPNPAVDWQATYTESSGEGGAIGFGEMHVTLDGAPDCDKQALLQAAVAVVLERLRGLTVMSQGGGEYFNDACHLLHLAIVEHLHMPRIEVTAHVRHNNSDTGEAGASYLNTRIWRMGRTMTSDYLPGYNPDNWPLPSPYAHSSAAWEWAHYWQNPCISIHGVPNVELQPEPMQEWIIEGEAPDMGGPPEIISPGDQEPQLPAENPSQVNPLNQQTSVVFYQAECDFDVEGGRIHLPAASWITGETPAAAAAPNGWDSVFARVHSGMATKKIRLHAERMGQWPVLPKAVDFFVDANGITYALLDYKLYPSPPLLTADGRTKLYRLQVHYTYGMSRAPRSPASASGLPGDKLSLSVDPRALPAPTDVIFDLSTVFTENQTP